MTDMCWLCGKPIGRDANGVSYCSAAHAASFMSKVYALTGLIPAIWVHEDCNRKVVSANVQRYSRQNGDGEKYARVVLKIVSLSRLGHGVRQIGRELGINKNRVTRTLQCWRALDPISVSQSLPEDW